MNQRKVTAIVTSYKRDWFFVDRALRSIEAQTVPALEILLVDDNDPASRESQELKQKVGETHPAVRYLSQGKNMRVARARNFGVENARGDWVAFLDDDDEWLPEKLEKQLALIEQHPDAGLVFGMGKIFSEDNVTHDYTWQHEVFKEHPTYVDMLANDHVGSTSHPLIRRDVFLKLGGFRPSLPAVEDYDLWIRVSREYPVWGTEDVLYLKYMPAGEHVSGNPKKLFQSYAAIRANYLDDYRKNPKAHTNILYNIMRQGVFCKTPRVIPVGFQWLYHKIRHGGYTFTK